MFNSSITSTWNGCPSGKLLFSYCIALYHASFATLFTFLASYEIVSNIAPPTGQVACPAAPGRPFNCVDADASCPPLCGPGLQVCGLRRVNGQLVNGTDGFPLPNCVPVQSAGSSLCDQPNIRPLPANFTGGNGMQRWNTMRLNGISDKDGQNAGAVAEIGSDPFSGGPAFFAGNGSDSKIQVQVRRMRC
jgi:hypothetical protein